MSEIKSSIDTVYAAYEKTGIIPHIYGLVDLGSPNVRFDPNGYIFGNLTPEQLSSALSVACARVVLDRLSTALPSGLKDLEFGKRLLAINNYVEQIKGAINGLAIRTMEGLSYTEYTNEDAKGLLAETLIYLSAIANNVPFCLSSLDEDRLGTDFILSTEHGDLNFDVTASAFKDTLKQKALRNGITVLYVPVAGSQILKGSTIERSVNVLITSLGRANKTVSQAQICEGIIHEVLDLSQFKMILPQAINASRALYSWLPFYSYRAKIEEANNNLETLERILPPISTHPVWVITRK